MSLVDSYRRRGKKPKPFPVTAPRTVEVGDGAITTYTFGKDLYADMLARDRGRPAADPASRPTSGRATRSASGSRPRSPTAADRGVEVYCIYDGFANLVVSPAFKRFPPSIKVLRYPSTAPAGGSSTCAATAATTARSWSSTTRSGSSAATTSASAYETEWRDTHVPDHRPGRLGPATGRSPTSGTCTGAGSSMPSERPLLLETASELGAARSGSSATCRGCGCSRSAAMYLEAINRASRTSG